MSHLTGNPYEGDADMYAVEACLRASWDEEERVILAGLSAAHSTMALAFEQRTANLIALLDHTRTQDSVMALKEVVWERLGLCERKATK